MVSSRAWNLLVDVGIIICLSRNHLHNHHLHSGLPLPYQEVEVPYYTHTQKRNWNLHSKKTNTNNSNLFLTSEHHAIKVDFYPSFPTICLSLPIPLSNFTVTNPVVKI